MPVSTPRSPRNASIDALRVLGVLGVVAIHASNARQSEPFALIFDELGRFAVPMFFVLSAYFWKPEALEHPGRLALRVAGRVLPAFVFFAAVMAAIGWLGKGDSGIDPTPLGVFALVWGGGDAAPYLWFLPALIVSTALVASGIRWLGWRVTAALAVLAYLVGCAIGPYGPILFGEGSPLTWYRNGVLFAPLFLVAGIYLRRHRELVLHVPLPQLFLAAAGFALLHLGEGVFVLGRKTMGHDYGLMTAPYAIAMVLVFMRLDIRGGIWEVLGRASFGAYLIHPLLLLFLVPVTGQVPLAPFILICTAVSLALVAGYQTLRSRLWPA
jgi:peptidoglycan/LPS O-acetylase OafA/YrhL